CRTRSIRAARRATCRPSSPDRFRAGRCWPPRPSRSWANWRRATTWQWRPDGRAYWPYRWVRFPPERRCVRTSPCSSKRARGSYTGSATMTASRSGDARSHVQDPDPGGARSDDARSLVVAAQDRVLVRSAGIHRRHLLADGGGGARPWPGEAGAPLDTRRLQDRHRTRRSMDRIRPPASRFADAAVGTGFLVPVAVDKAPSPDRNLRA